MYKNQCSNAIVYVALLASKPRELSKVSNGTEADKFPHRWLAKFPKKKLSPEAIQGALERTSSIDFFNTFNKYKARKVKN